MARSVFRFFFFDEENFGRFRSFFWCCGVVNRQGNDLGRFFGLSPRRRSVSAVFLPLWAVKRSRLKTKPVGFSVSVVLGNRKTDPKNKRCRFANRPNEKTDRIAVFRFWVHNTDHDTAAAAECSPQVVSTSIYSSGVHLHRTSHIYSRRSFGRRIEGKGVRDFFLFVENCFCSGRPYFRRHCQN